MAAVIDGEQFQMRIFAERGVIVDVEGDQGIVFGHDDQRGDADVFEKLIRRLRAVIIGGGAEAEHAGGVEIVEVGDGADLFEMVDRVEIGGLAGAAADFAGEGEQEAAIVNQIFALAQCCGARG